MVNDPEQEREGVGGREPMEKPEETDPQITRKDDEELEAPDFAPEKQPEK
ncbi:MAG TPA: hypothetical protein VM674_07105 [Candidatus Acidoferrum sp.]|nr:hypothetical protein [Candidatus Acidoferrum sp.]